jgi:hypothetical protein
MHRLWDLLWSKVFEPIWTSPFWGFLRSKVLSPVGTLLWSKVLSPIWAFLWVKVFRRNAFVAFWVLFSLMSLFLVALRVHGTRKCLREGSGDFVECLLPYDHAQIGWR